MMEERGLSPVVATVLLIGITVMAAVPIVSFITNYYAPYNPRFVDLVVYAGMVNENIVRFHIQHIGGDAITFETDKPTTDRIRGTVFFEAVGIENEMYCWTFENPRRFRQSDWAFSEVQIHTKTDTKISVGATLNVSIYDLRGYILYQADVMVNSLDQIPGG